MDRELYYRVEAFVRERLGEPAEGLTPETRLAQDLGLFGQTGTDFMVAFSEEFGVDLSGFDLGEYFGAGGEDLGAEGEEVAPPVLPELFYLEPFIAGRLERLPAITLRDLAICAEEGRWPPS